MRNPFANKSPAALRVGIARTGIAVLQAGGWRSPARVIANRELAPGERAPAQPASPEALTQSLREIIGGGKFANMAATITLADQWVRLFMVTPPQNTTSLQDCEAAAAMRFQELYGEPASDWALSADWQAHQAFLTCAMPKKMLAMLHQLASEQGLTLISIAPQFIAAWNRWSAELDGSAWFGIAQGEVLTLAAIHQKKLHAVRAAPVPGGAWQDPSWLPTHLAREALRLNLPTPGQLQLCGHIVSWPMGVAGKAQPEKIALPAICKRLDSDLRATSPGDGSMSAALQLALTGAQTA